MVINVSAKPDFVSYVDELESTRNRTGIRFRRPYHDMTWFVWLNRYNLEPRRRGVPDGRTRTFIR